MKNKKGLKENHAEKEKRASFNALSFAKENRGFMVALLILLASVLFLQVSIKADYSEEKANYTLQMYLNNQSEIQSYLDAVDEQIAEGTSDEIDRAFLDSTRSEFVWMKNKEAALFNSKPSADLYAKEAAFSVFLLKMIELNDAASIRVGETDSESEINSVANQPIEIPVLFTPDKVIELFEGDVREASIFSNTLNYLFTDYIDLKKQALNDANTTSSEYVESKKLALIPQLGEYE